MQNLPAEIQRRPEPMLAIAANTHSRKSILLRALYLALVTALLYGLFSHWAYDDPFITYRYAESLSQGRGLVYNPGERVLSTTTPLFALLLAALAPVWSDLPHLANFLSAFGLALGGVFLWDLARSWHTPAVGWAGLLLYPTFPLLATTFGSETPLYLAFCLGAYASYARRRYAWTGALAALAVLARPDGVLVAVLLGIDYLVRVRRPIPWRALLVFLAVTLPWFGFAWIYYGSPLPVTLAAKQQQGALLISERFAPGFLTIAKDYVGYPNIGWRPPWLWQGWLSWRLLPGAGCFSWPGPCCTLRLIPSWGSAAITGTTRRWRRVSLPWWGWGLPRWSVSSRLSLRSRKRMARSQPQEVFSRSSLSCWSPRWPWPRWVTCSPCAGTPTGGRPFIRRWVNG
jgi:hypothetical protein